MQFIIAVGYCNFFKIMSKRSIASGGTSDETAARSVDSDTSAVFDTVCKKVESADSEVYTVDELMEEMQSLSGNSFDPYSGKYMKKKLQERYGDNIFFADVCGRKNVLCFRNMAQCIINDKWYADREDDAGK